MRRHAALCDTSFETLHEGLPSTRIERADDALIAVINDVHFEFSFEPSDSCMLWISVDPQLVVTARTKPLRLADVVVQIVRDATSRIDAIEDDLLVARLDNNRARLGGLEFSVVLGDMQALQECIKLRQEEIAANVNEDNNHSPFVLTAVTVVTMLALPINIMAGLFGMNVGSIPLA